MVDFHQGGFRDGGFQNKPAHLKKKLSNFIIVWILSESMTHHDSPRPKINRNGQLESAIFTEVL